MDVAKKYLNAGFIAVFQEINFRDTNGTEVRFSHFSMKEHSVYAGFDQSKPAFTILDWIV